MSYQSEVLLDNPAVYLALDTLGGASNGQTVPDLSVNELDGTLFYSATLAEQAWGFASPIETLASSREFRGWNNAGAGGLTGKSYIHVGNDALLQPSNDFAAEEWLRPLADLPLSGDFLMVGKSGTGGTMQTFETGARIGGYVIDTDDTLWKVWDPSFVFTDNLNESFHVVLVRSANSLLLYINGYLRNTTSITSGLATKVSSNDFFVHPNTSFYLNARHDEAAFYTHSLSAGRVLAHYEAAKAVLPLRATITINVGVELNTDQIVPKDLGFAHNFSDTFGDGQIPIVEEISYRTNVIRVSQTISKGLERGHTAPTGRWNITCHHRSGAGRSRLHGALYAPGQTYCLPVWSDSGVLPLQATSGAGTISCDTTKRDYQVGSYVGICSDFQNPPLINSSRLRLLLTLY